MVNTKQSPNFPISYQSKEHADQLDDIRECDGVEASHQGIEDRDSSRNHNSPHVIHTKDHGQGRTWNSTRRDTWMVQQV